MNLTKHSEVNKLATKIETAVEVVRDWTKGATAVDVQIAENVNVQIVKSTIQSLVNKSKQKK